MDSKLKTLEELCELMTIQIVTQNQSFINANCNLINEIRSLKDIIKKQDVSGEDGSVIFSYQNLNKCFFKEDFNEFKAIIKNIEKNQQVN